MLRVILAAVNAVAPVVLTILLGYWLKCRGFLSKEFLQKGNWLVFHLTLPAMLFINVYKLDSLGDVNWPVLLFCLGMICVLFLLGLVYSMAVTRRGDRRGVIWQSCFRSNFAILGFAIAAALGGSEAETLAAVASIMSMKGTCIRGRSRPRMKWAVLQGMTMQLAPPSSRARTESTIQGRGSGAE